jgi:hypothetical protein
VLLVTSVEKVTKQAIKIISIGTGSSLNVCKKIASWLASPELVNTAAIEKPAPNKKIISKGIFLLSDQSRILIGGINKSKPAASNNPFSFNPNPG